MEGMRALARFEPAVRRAFAAPVGSSAPGEAARRRESLRDVQAYARQLPAPLAL